MKRLFDEQRAGFYFDQGKWQPVRHTRSGNSSPDGPVPCFWDYDCRSGEECRCSGLQGSGGHVCVPRTREAARSDHDCRIE
jgi:hypothetical protein